MTNREICNKVLDTFTDDQLVHVATVLLSLRQLITGAQTDYTAQQTYNEYFSAGSPYEAYVLPPEEAERIRQEKEKYK